MDVVATNFGAVQLSTNSASDCGFEFFSSNKEGPNLGMIRPKMGLISQ